MANLGLGLLLAFFLLVPFDATCAEAEESLEISRIYSDRAIKNFFLGKHLELYEQMDEGYKKVASKEQHNQMIKALIDQFGALKNYSYHSANPQTIYHEFKSWRKGISYWYEADTDKGKKVLIMVTVIDGRPFPSIASFSYGIPDSNTIFHKNAKKMNSE